MRIRRFAGDLGRRPAQRNLQAMKPCSRVWLLLRRCAPPADDRHGIAEARQRLRPAADRSPFFHAWSAPAKRFRLGFQERRSDCLQSATELRLVASIDQPTNLCVSGRGMYGRDVVDPPGRSLPQTSSSRGPGDRAGMWVVCRTTSSDCTSGLTASSGGRLNWRFWFGSWQAGSSARMCRRVEASQSRATVETHGSPSRQRIWGIGTPARTTQASGEDEGQC